MFNLQKISSDSRKEREWGRGIIIMINILIIQANKFKMKYKE
jgi:hypothetical protein